MELGGCADCAAESDDSASVASHSFSNHGMVERDMSDQTML
jgi:hypothetical protein